jgi:hypothetical protein
MVFQPILKILYLCERPKYHVGHADRAYEKRLQFVQLGTVQNGLARVARLFSPERKSASLSRARAKEIGPLRSRKSLKQYKNSASLARPRMVALVM